MEPLLQYFRRSSVHQSVFASPNQQRWSKGRCRERLLKLSHARVPSLGNFHAVLQDPRTTERGRIPSDRLFCNCVRVAIHPAKEIAVERLDGSCKSRKQRTQNGYVQKRQPLTSNS